MMKRILIFDNHPDSLRLMHTAGLLQAANEHCVAPGKITSVICAAILIAMVVVAMLWPLL